MALFPKLLMSLRWTHQPDTVISVVSALAAFLALGTEQIALRAGQAVSGLLNASLGNIVELINAGIALRGYDLDLVQGSLLGGLLGNHLLVLGVAFIDASSVFHSEEFQPMVAQSNSSSMTVSIIALVTLDSDS
ncbi:hypothetical protein BDM02DRAFT_3269745 [Thelephora ganbajun]|uniref:Uncharacterized protein n=1 Tax=Thelephora ganbajun TaxID=370292 RepID=A0ACB6ZFM9_THEGA|nr:hypothetical protein BDM02DRAFT_3269745 [Thelephora ganbajun]